MQKKYIQNRRVFFKKKNNDCFLMDHSVCILLQHINIDTCEVFEYIILHTL